MARVALELQPCCGNRSGIGTYTYEIAKRMHSTTGLDFCGNVFNFMGREQQHIVPSDFTFPIQYCKIMPYALYRRMWNYLPLSYTSLFELPSDVGVFFDYIVPPRFSGKAIQVIHDLSYLRYPETMNKRNLRRLRGELEASIARSSRIVTISEFSRSEIVRMLRVPQEKIDIVSPAPANMTLMCGEGENNQTAEHTEPFVLYVGTLEPRKNLERLIQAFDMLKKTERIPHKLILAGGAGWGTEGISSAVRAASCADDIKFTGYVSVTEKRALYQNADVFVFPSLYEGFGIPPLEAMEMGCPVVCANAASLPEVVGDAARLVDPWDVRSIADGILNVLTDEEYADSLRRKGKKQFEKYTWDTSAERLTKICCSVVEGL